MDGTFDAVYEILDCYGFSNVSINDIFINDYINIDDDSELSKCLRKIFYPLIKISIEDVKFLNTFWNDHPSGLYSYVESIKYFRSKSIVLLDGSNVSWDIDIICSIFNNIGVYTGVCVIEDNKYIKHKLIIVPYKKVLTNSISKEILNHEEFIKKFYTTDNIIYSNVFNIDYLERDYTMCIIYNKLLNPIVYSFLDKGYVYGRVDIKEDLFLFGLYKYCIIVYLNNNSVIEYRILNWEINNYSSIITLLVKFCLEEELCSELFSKYMYKLQTLV